MKNTINRNYQRLTVHLLNTMKKKHFVNTYTFNNVPSELEARHTIRTMLQNDTESDESMSNRIVKSYYNGEPFIYRTDKYASTSNGWIIK